MAIKKPKEQNQESKDQFLIEVDILIYIKETLTPIERENIIQIREYSRAKVLIRHLE